MIDSYLNQTASLVTPASASTVDGYGRPSGSDSTVTMKCRCQGSDKFIVLPDGTTVRAVQTLWTKTPCTADQKIIFDGDTYRILLVKTERTLGGSALFYRAELG